MKINKILVALSFFMVILCQIASARNIIERDMGANKGDVPANIAILDSDSNVVAKNMTGISDSTAISLSDVEVIAHRKNIKLSGHNLLVDVEHDSILNHQNDIYELIGKVPGVLHVGNSFNVLGKGAPVYYLNGRKVRDQSLIDNLPVDQIKSSSNPQPIGFSGILLAKRQNSFYCTYFLHNRNVADTKSPYPIKRLEVIRWFNQKSMAFNQSLS